jgi:hypothetical protein
MGFFAWLREGVRRAVLLGFSDALAQMGTRSQSEELGPQLAAALQQGIALENHEAGLPAPPNGRRRLGKSLEQIAGAAPNRAA